VTLFRSLSVLCTAAVIAGCTTKDPEALAQNDPWEPTNRAIFDFDVKLDHLVATPIAKFYRSAVPEPARKGVHNALDNLHAPVVLINDVLQGDTNRAGETIGRFIINSTAGLAGFIDVGAKFGIPSHENDFGITLGMAGAQQGSYLVLPLVGPKPPRDLVGMGVDIAFDPVTYMTWNNSTLYMIVRTGLTALDQRTANIDSIDAIERSSIDFYASTRSAYQQYRDGEIHNGATPNQDLPNF
jgi:phospholipid-binding lipoprotein MlaA